MTSDRARPRVAVPAQVVVARAHVAALVMAPVVEVGLRLWPLPKLAARLGVPLSLDTDRPATVEEASTVDLTARQRLRVVAIDRIFRRWPFGDTCLRRSLVWGHTLRSRSPVLRLGVTRTVNGDIAAHSWLEFDGLGLGTESNRAYRPLRQLGPDDNGSPSPGVDRS